MSTYDWVAGHWGAEGLTLWCMAGERVLDQRASVVGLGDLGAGDHAPVLLSLVQDRPAGVLPVVLCGSVSGPKGWVPVVPPAVPVKLPLAPVAVDSGSDEIALSLMPGVVQARPSDMVHGAETQIAGFLALNPRFDGVVLVPGQVTIWAHVSAGELVSFRGFMTQSMLEALSAMPGLKGRIAVEGLEADSYANAISEGMSHPQRLAGTLQSLATDPSIAPESARSQLLGALIGAELAAARPYWLGQSVALLDGSPLSGAYSDALIAQGGGVLRADGARMLQIGLVTARALLVAE